jgi:hypothetical protein
VQCLDELHRLDISAVVAQYQIVYDIGEPCPVYAVSMFVEHDRVLDRSQAKCLPSLVMRWIARRCRASRLPSSCPPKASWQHSIRPTAPHHYCHSPCDEVSYQFCQRQLRADRRRRPSLSSRLACTWACPCHQELTCRLHDLHYTDDR